MKTNWEVEYLDFDGELKTTKAEVVEPEQGVFYAQGVMGCGKRCDASVHWKPIKAALQSLVGLDRPVKNYYEV